MPMQVDQSMRLTPDQYIPERQEKDLVVLHHTVGGTARSTFEWWQTGDREQRVATAYIIDRDGIIYEVFDPAHWAYHLGLKGAAGAHDKRSIGIELASEGGLREVGWEAVLL